MSLFPELPQQDAHKAKALDAVEAIFRKIGWPSERVAFSEDIELLVRIPSGAMLPPVRVWFAVQGKRNLTQFRKQGRHYAVPADSELGLRWLQRRETTIAVLWNAERGLGFWTLPHLYLFEMELLLDPEQRQYLIFIDDMKFAAGSAERIAAIAHIQRCEAILALTLVQMEGLNSESVEGIDEEITTRVMAPVAIAMREIGLTKDGALTEAAIKAFHKARRELEEASVPEDDDLDPEDLLNEACLEIFEDRLDELTGGLLAPRNLGTFAPQLLLDLLRHAGEVPDDAAEPE
jgi:hypothetical protein